MESPNNNRIVSKAIDSILKIIDNSDLSSSINDATQKGTSVLLNGVKHTFTSIIRLIDAIRKIFELIASSMIICILLMITLLILILVTIAYVIVQMAALCKSMWNS